MELWREAGRSRGAVMIDGQHRVAVAEGDLEIGRQIGGRGTRAGMGRSRQKIVEIEHVAITGRASDREALDRIPVGIAFGAGAEPMAAREADMLARDRQPIGTAPALIVAVAVGAVVAARLGLGQAAVADRKDIFAGRQLALDDESVAAVFAAVAGDAVASAIVVVRAD
jgi:hypothetical protein